jgi:hypothetical protein
VSKHFLMVTNDGERESGRKIFASVLVQWRLQQMLWPLYSQTKNRRLVQPGAKLLFYQGGTGPGRQTIVGWAEVLEILDGRRIDEIDPHYSLSSPCRTALRLGNVTSFEEPVPLRPLVGKLSLFPPGMKYWGVKVMGGCKKLTPDDFATVLEAASPQGRQRH